MDYGEVMQELVAALGAALLFANVLAIARRGDDAQRAKERTVARSRPGSPVRGYGRTATGDLAQAPLARSLLYAAVGFLVMIWALASRFG